MSLNGKFLKWDHVFQNTQFWNNMQESLKYILKILACCFKIVYSGIHGLILKIYHLKTFKSIQLRGIKCICTVVQLTPPFFSGTFFFFSNRKLLYSLKNSFTSFSPLISGLSLLFSVSAVGSSCMWNHTVFAFLWLMCFT